MTVFLDDVALGLRCCTTTAAIAIFTAAAAATAAAATATATAAAALSTPTTVRRISIVDVVHHIIIIHGAIHTFGHSIQHRQPLLSYVFRRCPPHNATPQQ